MYFSPIIAQCIILLYRKNGTYTPTNELKSIYAGIYEIPFVKRMDKKILHWHDYQKI